MARRLWSSRHSEIQESSVHKADASAGLQHMQNHGEVGSNVSEGIDLPVRMTESMQRVGFLLPSPLQNPSAEV